MLIERTCRFNTKEPEFTDCSFQWKSTVFSVRYALNIREVYNNFGLSKGLIL